MEKDWPSRDMKLVARNARITGLGLSVKFTNRVFV